MTYYTFTILLTRALRRVNIHGNLMGPILKPTYKYARVREPKEQRWPWVIFPTLAILSPASAFFLGETLSSSLDLPSCLTNLVEALLCSLRCTNYSFLAGHLPSMMPIVSQAPGRFSYGPWPLLPLQAYLFKAHMPAGDGGCPLTSLWVHVGTCESSCWLGAA